MRSSNRSIVSFRGILSHPCLRKARGEISVVTGFGRPPGIAEDFSVFWRWPVAFDGVEDVLGFAEVLLPKASTSATHPAPFGVIVIRVSVDVFFFQAFHI